MKTYRLHKGNQRYTDRPKTLFINGMAGFSVLLALLFSTSCYKEIVVPDDTTFSGSLNFLMQIEQEEAIYDAYDEKLDIEPEPQLVYEKTEFELSDFELRGESALRYRKKSFNVETVVPLEFTNSTISLSTAALRDMKLISLVSDYTYIENRVAFGLLRQINIQPLFHVFKEVTLNYNTQGLYLLIEAPTEYLLKENHECLIRRGRNGTIADNWFYANYSGFTENDYAEKFESIYSMITAYQGEELYDSLSAVMNITNYFRRTAIDLLLQNGDSSDEIYFMAINNGDKIYFDIIPWDCDDMFSELPHEIGRDYGTGDRFGERIYNTMDDVIADVGEKLIFSIEDDLDYIIAKDAVLYKKYLIELNYVLNTIDEASIELTFENTGNELTPFLMDDKIIEQTIYCAEQFTFDDFSKNIVDKQNFVKARRTELINKLNEHDKLYGIQ